MNRKKSYLISELMIILEKNQISEQTAHIVFKCCPMSHLPHIQTQDDEENVNIEDSISNEQQSISSFII